MASISDQAPNAHLTPRQVVEELDRYIVGQRLAKRAVAIALRNRYRREALQGALRDEVSRKTFLLIGPTGVGKTEIARRLATLAQAPFLKVEATRYTEVGYVGRDVESMVRDLVEQAVRTLTAAHREAVREQAEEQALQRLLAVMAPSPQRGGPASPLGSLFGGLGAPHTAPSPVSSSTGPIMSDEQLQHERARLRALVLAGELDTKTVELELEDLSTPEVPVGHSSGLENVGAGFHELLAPLLPKRKKTRTVTIAEARRLLAQEEAARLVDMDEVRRDAVARAEQHGIIFLDEIDKIASRERGGGPEVSREGVQRDILPIVEGTTVTTRYGPIRTHHILFIAAGAFHVSKPSDLIPELQGRFPIRVELESLSQSDFVRILTEPENALIKQYTALLATDGVQLELTPDGVHELARLACKVNETTEDIGARRLHTMLEKVLDDPSFEAPDGCEGPLTVDGAYVRSRLESIVRNEDLSRFIL